MQTTEYEPNAPNVGKAGSASNKPRLGRYISASVGRWRLRTRGHEIATQRQGRPPLHKRVTLAFDDLLIHSDEKYLE